MVDCSGSERASESPAPYVRIVPLEKKVAARTDHIQTNFERARRLSAVSDLSVQIVQFWTIDGVTDWASAWSEFVETAISSGLGASIPGSVGRAYALSVSSGPARRRRSFEEAYLSESAQMSFFDKMVRMAFLWAKVTRKSDLDRMARWGGLDVPAYLAVMGTLSESDLLGEVG